MTFGPDEFDIEELKALLQLTRHGQEGGFFAETYRSDLLFPNASAKEGGVKARSIATAIYYLLTPTSVSMLHRIPWDEIFHFYLGDPVEMLQLYPDGSGRRWALGSDPRKGLRPQLIVPAGVWQGSRLLPGGRFSLLGTTMAPGFEPIDFEAGEREILSAIYPEFAAEIAALTR